MRGRQRYLSNAPPPRPSPPPAIYKQSSHSGLGDTIKQGMALGAGSAVGSMAVNSIGNMMSSSSRSTVPSTSIGQNNNENNFIQCMKYNNEEFDKCQNEYYILKNSY